MSLWSQICDIVSPDQRDLREATADIREIGATVSTWPRLVDTALRREREACARVALAEVGTWQEEELQLVAERTAEKIARAILDYPGARPCPTCTMPMTENERDGSTAWYCGICQKFYCFIGDE